MKPFIYPEMMVHIPLCTHKKPENILVVSDSADALQEEIARYSGAETAVVAASNALDGLREAADQSSDVVLMEASADAAMIAHISRILKDDGLVVMKHPSLDDEQANTVLMGQLGSYFKIIMPYTTGAGETLLLASKEYHPTADVILQRTDLLEGQQYYNCDIHQAAFAMPNYIRKAYLGVIRN
ncbi:MAG: spermidine synthase [Campylobacterota bacterium]|nr:spermidine synthase [Campylobacterota bacterium]